MFSFHKPKVYRSSTGCCICKAKSSSSRFTDSKKYEDDFVECFQLQERRTGEICNACVLLVKRWKKLPAGSNRNWRHVVDARAGPGIKSLTKFKSKNKKKMKDKLDKFDKVKKKHIYLKSETERGNSPAMSDDLTEYYNSMEPESKGSSRSESPADIDSIIEKQMDVVIEESDLKKNVNEFIDLSYFKREIICCGTIFKGPHGEIIVDPSQFKLCINCLEARRQQQRESDSSSTSEAASPVHSASTSPMHSVELPEATRTTVVAVVQQNNQVSKSNTFSDSSSDSGYDEYLSQGTDSNKTVKSVQKIKLLPSSVEQMDQTTCKSLTVVSDSSQIQPISN